MQAVDASSLFEFTIMEMVLSARLTLGVSSMNHTSSDLVVLDKGVELRHTGQADGITKKRYRQHRSLLL